MPINLPGKQLNFLHPLIKRLIKIRGGGIERYVAETDKQVIQYVLLT